MKRSFLLTLVMLTSFGLAGAAMAETPITDADSAPKAEKITKGDKEFKKGDFKKRHEEMFAKTDKDGDGVLSKDEFLESHQERAEKAFNMLDTNKDGVLSKEELKEGRKHWKKRKPHGEHKGKADKAKPVQK